MNVVSQKQRVSIADPISQTNHPACVDDARCVEKTWPAILNLEFIRGPEKTYVHRSHRGPMSIQRAFYPEDDVCHVTLLHPPGGVVSGDHLTTSISVNPGAHAVMVTPGATKHYRSRGTPSALNNPIGRVTQRANVNGGTLEWLPNEAIHFDGSETCVDSAFHLSGEAKVIATDVQVFGRQAGDLPFVSGQADVGLSVFINRAPVLLDRLRVSGANSATDATGLRGHTVYATLFATSGSDDLVNLVRERLNIRSETSKPLSAPYVSVTRVDSLLLVRYLGDNSEQALQILRRVRALIRPAVIGRKAYTPRIWST